VRIIVAGDLHSLRRFADETSVAEGLVADPTGEAAERYGALRVPLGVFVGPDGRIQRSVQLTPRNVGDLLSEFVRQFAVPSAAA
jgi:hypothetical protein